MAEIAIATPSSITDCSVSPRTRPKMTIRATAAQAMPPNTLVSVSSSRCSGDLLGGTADSIAAIRPIWVDIPVSVMTIEPVPRVTEVF